MPRTPRSSTPPACLNALRNQIRRLETFPAPTCSGAQLGAPAIDAALGPGLAVDGLHEVTPASAGDQGAATGFALALLARLMGQRGGEEHASPLSVIHIAAQPTRSEYGRLYRPGLGPLAGAAWMFVTVRRPNQALHAAEETLRSHSVTGVLLETHGLDFTASRRLTLAANDSGAALVALCAPRHHGATAAQTRWRISAAPSASHRDDPRAPGTARWRAALVRARQGRLGHWDVEWDDAAGCLCVVDTLGPGSVAHAALTSGGRVEPIYTRP